MVRKILSSASAICVGYTLMTLVLVNGTKAEGDILDDIYDKVNSSDDILNMIWNKVNSIATTIGIMKGNITTMSKVINSTNEIVSRCNVADGFFFTPGNSQCLKLFLDEQRTWDEAGEKCKNEGLVLARPYNPKNLRRYLMDGYDLNGYIWLGARGNGSHLLWQTDRPGQSQVLDNNSSLWWNGANFAAYGGYCLSLLTDISTLTKQPDHPYDATYCALTFLPLCEKPL